MQYWQKADDYKNKTLKMFYLECSGSMNMSVHLLVYPMVAMVTVPFFKSVNVSTRNNIEAKVADICSIHVVVEVNAVITAGEQLRIDLWDLVFVSGGLNIYVITLKIINISVNISYDYENYRNYHIKRTY